jgi:hypothetical protein
VSHYYPKHKFEDCEVVSVDDVNENFRDAIDEMQGNLGEQNFKRNAFTSLEDIASSAAIRVHHRNIICDPFETHTGFAFGEVPQPNGQTEKLLQRDMMILGDSEEFQPIADLSVDIITDNSILWIMTSFQQSMWNPSDATSGEGVQYALRVDGSVIYETVTGGLDTENEPQGMGTNNTTVGVTIDAIIPITGGVHKVEVVYRLNHQDSDMKSVLNAIGVLGAGPAVLGNIADGLALTGVTGAFTGTSATSDSQFYRVLNRNLIIVEMR